MPINYDVDYPKVLKLCQERGREIERLTADHKKAELMWWDEKGELDERIAELEAELKATQDNEQRLADFNKPLLARACKAEADNEHLAADSLAWHSQKEGLEVTLKNQQHTCRTLSKDNERLRAALLTAIKAKEDAEKQASKEHLRVYAEGLERAANILNREAALKDKDDE